ncbi:hypothetical protein D3C87_2124070 [compost metagenome]
MYCTGSPSESSASTRPATEVSSVVGTPYSPVAGFNTWPPIRTSTKMGTSLIEVTLTVAVAVSVTPPEVTV